MNALCLVNVLVAAILASSQCPIATASQLDNLLRPLHHVTENFLDLLQPASKSPLLREIVLKLINGTNVTPLDLVQSMQGNLILIGLGLLLSIAVPIAGCCVCCWSNSRSGQLNHTERKGTRYHSVLGLVFATLMLFGGVYAMMANQQLHVQLRDPSPSSSATSSSSGGTSDTALGALSAAFGGTMDLMQSAPRKGREAAPRFVSDLVTNLRSIINSTLVYLQTLLVNTTRADVTIAASRTFLRNLAVAQQAANASAAGNQELTNSLNDRKDKIRDIEHFTCPSGADYQNCQDSKTSIVNRSSTLGKLPMSTTLVNMTVRLWGLDGDSMLADINTAEAHMNNVSNAGMLFFTERLNFLNESQLKEILDRLENILSQKNDQLQVWRNLSFESAFDPLSGKDSTLGCVVSAFDAYRYSAYLVIAAFSLLLVLLFYLGLLFGLTGNRGVGARFLLAGATLGFIFYALIMIIVTVLFLPGSAIYTEVCRYIRNRPCTDGYRLIDDILTLDLKLGSRLSDFTINRPVSILFGGCSNGASLTEIIDIAQLTKMLNLNSTISKMLNDAKNKVAQQESKLVSHASSGISSLRDFVQRTVKIQQTDLTPYKGNLESAARDFEFLLEAVSKILRNANDVAVKDRFKILADSLNTTQALIAKQTARLNHLSTVMADLGVKSSNVTVKLNFTDSVVQKPGILMRTLNTATADLVDNMIGQVNAAVGSLLVEMIDCAKLGQYLRQIVDVPCVRLLQPFNGFWAGIGIWLMCLLPCLVLAIQLANSN